MSGRIGKCFAVVLQMAADCLERGLTAHPG